MCDAESRKSIEWTCFTDQNVTCPHIHCHEIQKENEDIPLLVTSLQENSDTALGLVLINTHDSYNIDPTLLQFHEKVDFPILVVSSSTGRRLKDTLKHHQRNVQARVELGTPVTATAGKDGRTGPGL